MTLAIEVNIFDMPMKAAGDLSAKQYYGMKVSADFTVTTAGAADAALIGILQNKPAAAGRSASVRKVGISKVVLGGTVAAGDRLTTDSSGKLIKTTTSNNRYCAIAIEGGDSGDTVSAVMEFGYVP